MRRRREFPHKLFWKYDSVDAEAADNVQQFELICMCTLLQVKLSLQTISNIKFGI